MSVELRLGLSLLKSINIVNGVVEHKEGEEDERSDEEGAEKKKVTLSTAKTEPKPKSLAKTYYRRGMGYMGKSDWEKARADFDESLKIDPGMFSGSLSN